MNEKLDTRRTDYALGELDEAARLEYQAQLAGDAEARSETDEIAKLGAVMRAATVRSHASVEDRNALLQDIVAAHLAGQAKQAETVSLPVAAASNRSLWLGGLAVAASVLLLASLSSFAVWKTISNAKMGRVAMSTLEADSSSSPVPTATGGIDETVLGDDGYRYDQAGEKHGGRVHLRLQQPNGPSMPSPLNSNVAGVTGVTIAPNVAAPKMNTTVGSNPTNVKVDVGAVNVFTASGGQFVAAVPEASGVGVDSNGTVAGNITNNGVLTFSNNNTYSGATTLTAGTPLVVNGATSSSVGNTITGAGTLILGSDVALATTPAPSSSPSLEKKSGAPQDPRYALAIEHQQLTAKYGPNHPRVRELELKVQVVQQHLEADRAKSEPPAGEAYDAIVENPFLNTLDVPLSTFSIDVDTASYSNVRRFLNAGQLPPRNAVRIEEFLNYFPYAYPQPKGADPFSITTEAARCPWNAEHVLVRVGLKGREIHTKERPATNLVFLVDVSGSMQSADKLPLVRESLKMLVRELGDRDRVAIVVYAGSTGLVLPSTGGDRKPDILQAIDRLEAGGSTNGGAGIQLAYQVAVDNFIKGGVNRVVLATDGDFNVGVTNRDDLVKLIEEKAKTKVFFSGLAYGTGNLKDATLEQLANKGNGNYAYIDTLAEARKVLVEQMSGTLVTIAKDVKVQIEFNPTHVQAYRLIGYENRVMAAQDFNNDKKDAGEIGAGHTVTALYELVPVGVVLARETVNLPAIDPLKYQQPQPKPKVKPQPKLVPTDAAKSEELLTLKLRYKQPEGDVSKLIERPLKNDAGDYARASGDFKFASSVAAFGMLLRDSQFRGSATLDAVLELAQEGIGKDEGGYRREFIELVRKARELKPTSPGR